MSIGPCNPNITDSTGLTGTTWVTVTNSDVMAHAVWLTCGGDLTIIADCVPSDTTITIAAHSSASRPYFFVANKKGTGTLTITAGDPPPPQVTTVVTVTFR